MIISFSTNSSIIWHLHEKINMMHEDYDIKPCSYPVRVIVM